MFTPPGFPSKAPLKERVAVFLPDNHLLDMSSLQSWAPPLLLFRLHVIAVEGLLLLLVLGAVHREIDLRGWE
jgi:hypothetical protein